MFKERYFIFQEGPDPMADIVGKAKKREKEVPDTALSRDAIEEKSKNRKEREERDRKLESIAMKWIEENYPNGISEKEYKELLVDQNNLIAENEEKIRKNLGSREQLAKMIDPKAETRELKQSESDKEISFNNDLFFNIGMPNDEFNNAIKFENVEKAKEFEAHQTYEALNKRIQELIDEKKVAENILAIAIDIADVEQRIAAN